VEIDGETVGAREDVDLDRSADDRRIGLDVKRLAGLKDTQVRCMGFRAGPMRENVGRDFAE
jgi:hypothetical protein